jgi:hypothetical protein
VLGTRGIQTTSMAALPVGALPLPLPAPAPAKLSLLFSDASKDPTEGNWEALMASFLHDVHNATNNTDTTALRDMVIASGTRNELLSFTVVHGNRARLYTLCMKWQDGLTGRNPELNGNFFALEGELIQDRGHIVEFDVGVFNLPNNVAVVPTVTAIVDALVADPTLSMMAGPYTAGDPDTEGVKTRKICPVPHSLAGLWLLHEEGITWQIFFGMIYPAIVAEGKEVAYKSLIQFMQQLAVGNPSTINCATRPAAPPRSAVLMLRYMKALEAHFPGLRQDAVAQQHSQIAGAIGRMVDQQQAHYDANKLAKEEKVTTTVAGWLGEDDFPAVLNLTNTRNDPDLIVACPVYKAMAAAPKSLKMARLQSAIDKILGDRGMEHLVVIITPAMFTIFASMKWHRVGPDSLTSGLFGNPFLWGACDEEATNALNLRAQFIHGGETAASDADAQALLKIVVNPPLEDESIDNFKRMEVAASVLLPAGHGFLIHLREHITSFTHYERKWRSLAMTNANLQGAKGALHLQFMALRFSKYWRAQRSSPARVTLSDPKELIDLIDMGRQWEPAVSHSLAASLKLGVLGRFSRAQARGDWDDDAKTQATQATAASTRSGITGLTIGNMSLSGTSGKSTVGDGKGKENANFHLVLFGGIKARTVGGKTVKSREVREKIKKGELPPLPPSKADGKPMCLAWHTKGICNPDCPRAADHGVVYSVEEYQPLCGWCDDNYPKDE